MNTNIEKISERGRKKAVINWPANQFCADDVVTSSNRTKVTVYKAINEAVRNNVIRLIEKRVVALSRKGTPKSFYAVSTTVPVIAPESSSPVPEPTTPTVEATQNQATEVAA